MASEHVKELAETYRIATAHAPYIGKYEDDSSEKLIALIEAIVEEQQVRKGHGFK